MSRPCRGAKGTGPGTAWTLTEQCEEAERTFPEVRRAANSYERMVRRAITTFPYHRLDDDSKVCSWSLTERCDDEACPNGCQGSRRPTVNG